MAEYLFVWDRERRCFGESRIILRRGDERDAEVDVVTLAEVEDLVARLRLRYPAPRFRVARAWANGWRAVERNYHGLMED